MSAHKINFSYLENLDKSNNYNRWIYDCIKPYLGNEILDIGSGLGHIIEYFPKDKKITLTDCDDKNLFLLSQRFAHQPVQIVKLDITNDKEALHFKDMDTVVSLNVLEHIENDLAAIKNISGMLKTGGIGIFFVPACPFLYTSLDKSLGHVRRYTLASLKSKILAAEFSIVRIEYFNIFGMFTWFLTNIVYRRGLPKAATCKVLDKLVPALSCIQQHFKFPAGQSILAVARKET